MIGYTNETSVTQVIDLTDPYNIVPAGRISHDDGLVTIERPSIAIFESAGGTYAAVASYEGIQVLDLTDPYNIVPAGIHRSGGYNIAIFESAGGTYAAVASRGGVQVLDLTDPYNIVPTDGISDDDNMALGSVRYIAAFESDGGTYAAVASREGMQVLDLTDPYNIVPAGHIYDDGSRYLSPISGIDIFESANRTYAVTALFAAVQVVQLTADAADRAAHGNGQGSATVSLSITTHNPACTAVHLDYLGTTRLTDVRPWYRNGTLGYTHDEIVNGVNIIAVIWAHDSNMTIPSILERPEVSSVATYSYIAPNSTETPALLAQANNTGVIWPDMGLPTKCGTLRPHMILLVMDVVGWGGAEPGTGPRGAMSANGTEPGSDGPAGQGLTDDKSGGPAAAGPAPLTLDNLVGERVDPESGLVYIGDMIGVKISAYNTTVVWEYLKENGALVTNVSLVRVESFVPPSLLGPLSFRDDVYNIVELVVDVLEQYGSTCTEGLLDENHSNVMQWHDIGCSGIAPNSTPVSLVVTTHDPGCTAIFVAGRNGVTLQTAIRPLPYSYHYTDDEIVGGVNVTFAMPAYQADRLMPALAERVEVSWVAFYSVTEPPRLLANTTNPNAHIPASVNDAWCKSKVASSLYKEAHAAIVKASGAATYGAVVHVHISTDISNAEPLAFLKENGATVYTVFDVTDKHQGFISADVPLSLLGQLSELDQVVGVDLPLEPHIP